MLLYQEQGKIWYSKFDFIHFFFLKKKNRCKVVILAIDNLFDRDMNKGVLESFSDTQLEPADGWSFLCLLKQWVDKRKSSFTWNI